MFAERNPTIDYVVDLIKGYMGTMYIHTICKLDIPEHLPMTAKELADIVRCKEETTLVLLNYGVALELFSNLEGIYSLTDKGKFLKRGGELRDLAYLHAEQFYEPWGHLFECVQSDKPVFEKVFGKTHFAYLQQKGHEEDARIFNNTMSQRAELLAGILAKYNFKDINSVVDVGGGYGTVLREILRNNSNLEGTLFDLPEVIDGADTNLNEFADRFFAVRGSFFEISNLPKKKDLYILVSVLHDWDDKSAIRILKNCAHAVGNSGKILVVESILNNINPDPYTARLDLHMLVVYGGKERTREEFNLLAEHAGLVVSNITPTNSRFNLIEMKKKAA